MSRKTKYENLKEACIEEAIRIIDTSGIENLSMREVARRLGVSHQAPYKHFESRDHILAEILKRSFEDFANHLNSHIKSGKADTDLATMGYAYLQYAAEKPLQYRLMFGTPLPNPEHHPEMMEKAQYAFSLLRHSILDMNLASDVDLNALYVWSTIHGLASILQMEMFDDLAIAKHNTNQLINDVIARIGTGLQ